LVLLALPYRADEFEFENLFEDPFVLAFPLGHPLADRSSVLSALAFEDDLLLLEEGHCLRDHALAACQLSTVPGGRQDRLLATSLATLVQMVAGGLGVTLLPHMALDCGILAGTGLVCRSLGNDAPTRTIGLAWRASSPRKAEFRLLGTAIRHVHDGK
jgi:LysR family hydrogen peroxide-inducible transcriptional activator